MMFTMSTVLYRKYRSQDFNQLIGQDHITKILKNAIKSDQISHAYLFVGSRGTGKTSTARIFAKAVNCTHIKKDGNPCNKCDICESINLGNYLDMIEIDAASNRGIDQIRELKEKIEFVPSKGRFKIYIIDEVHMLTTEAFNALLKTLEEPPAHVIFILATTDVHKLPPTILSRCQRYDFRLGTPDEVRNAINMVLSTENFKIEKEGLELVVKNARGSYRDALSLLDVVVNSQLKSKNPKEITEDEVRNVLGIPEVYMVDNFLSALINGDSKGALECINELESKGTNLVQFTSFTLEVLREVLVAKISGNDIEEYTFAEGLGLRDLLSLIKEFLNVERELKGNSNQILILQMLIPVFMEKFSDVREETKKKTIVEGKSESVEIVNSDVIVLCLDDVKKKWKSVVEATKPLNQTLFAFLNSSEPISIEENTLSIEVPFKFYKDQIDSAASRDIINQAIFDTLGTHCRVKCSVNESVKPKLKSNADVVLKSVPVIKKEEKKYPPKKSNPDIEAIFAGM